MMNPMAYPHILEPGDIRRYPSELARVPSRAAAKHAEGERGFTFSEITAITNGANPGAIFSTQLLARKSGKPFGLWEKDGFGFGDFIDIVNPLHHIPIVATFYRNLTGDQIGAAPRVIGGALWGRIGGFITGVANAVVELWSGKDIGDHIYTAIFHRPDSEQTAPAIAQKNEGFPAVPAEERSGAGDSGRLSGSGDSGWKVETPPARESQLIGPNALLFEMPLVISHKARISYEQTRNWPPSGRAFKTRFPA
jgi:hypothetical protein